ncbi:MULTISPECIES: CcdC protein domain-containing protein [unclassified Brevundimonas]|uniref:CcdC protein domain-containing protein n=1 Tax=unclassified Brevundimonas TaxID=2622653 RepID=UPI003F8F24B1
MSPQTMGPLIGIAVALIVVLLRNRRKRTLRPHLLWVMPLLVTIMIGMGLWATTQHPHFGPYAWMAFAAALALGAAAGWQRGKTITIEKEPDGSLKAQASPLGLILVIGLFAARAGLRELMQSNAVAWGLDAVVVTDAFMIFAIGLIVTQRIEMYIRARRVLAGGSDSHVEVAA